MEYGSLEQRAHHPTTPTRPSCLWDYPVTAVADAVGRDPAALVAEVAPTMVLPPSKGSA